MHESVPLCSANHAPPAAEPRQRDATAAGPAECSAPLQKADSPATEHGSTQATAVADERKDDASSASRKSLLARLKEASSCSPATRLRVQVNASHKPKARVRATCACERDQGVRVHCVRVSVAVFACGEPRPLSPLGTDAGRSDTPTPANRLPYRNCRLCPTYQRCRKSQRCLQASTVPRRVRPATR